MWTRRRALAGLVSTAFITPTLSFARPPITVYLTSLGDPRFGPSERGALSNAPPVFTNNTVDLAGVLEQKDEVWRLLQVVRRLWLQVQEVRAPLLRHRRVSLARSYEHTGMYSTELRPSALRLFSDVEVQLNRHISHQLRDVGSRNTVVCCSLLWPAVRKELERRGFSAVMVGEEELKESSVSAELFWAGLSVAFPKGSRGLQPWIDVLRPYQEVYQRWPLRSEFEAEIAKQAGERAPTLSKKTKSFRHIRRAMRLLKGRGFEKLSSVDLGLGTDEKLVMSYNPYHEQLKVQPWVQDLPLELTAVVLAHELIHVQDISDACEQLQCSPKQWMLLLDSLPPGVTMGIRLTLEDRAFYTEMDLLKPLDVRLDVVSEPKTDEQRLVALISSLSQLEPRSTQWLVAVDSMLGVR